ncbi:hypothetical protein VHEMI05156 [[Torrubiella] hemipterigena]|uniref:Uncharacterized protein n=1 Tax=[Torrubiella] hemipterigena TaxID=1531966 RepID=A0A0A1SX82_9HYPO|nr:hypothetical protein VHEMI05156 [[Torrubiella] hemipterigena]
MPTLDLQPSVANIANRVLAGARIPPSPETYALIHLDLLLTVKGGRVWYIQSSPLLRGAVYLPIPLRAATLADLFVSCGRLLVLSTSLFHPPTSLFDMCGIVCSGEDSESVRREGVVEVSEGCFFSALPILATSSKQAKCISKHSTVLL